MESLEHKKPNVGEPAPIFAVRSPVNPRFQFDTVAGRTVVLCFFGSAAEPASRAILDAFLARRDRFDDTRCCFFGVSVDSDDETMARVQEELPGFHLFWDFDRRVSDLYCVTDASDSATYSPRTFVLDERLRIAASIPFSDHVEQHVVSTLQAVAALPHLKPATVADVPAPVLLVPRIFEPELCRTLMRYYDEHGGQDSGFMREVDGKTIGVHDHVHKRRRDQDIVDQELRSACRNRIHDRLAPEVQKAFQFRATRIERYIVGCYDSSSRGHFRPHRDNTTKGTAHRRFAISLNLNTGEFEGGMLRFPEFGQQLYSPSAGGAVVFSCSLLHEAIPVTSGVRYVFLPFLYDDEAARIREENLQYVAGAASPS